MGTYAKCLQACQLRLLEHHRRGNSSLDLDVSMRGRPAAIQPLLTLQKHGYNKANAGKGWFGRQPTYDPLPSLLELQIGLVIIGSDGSEGVVNEESEFLSIPYGGFETGLPLSGMAMTQLEMASGDSALFFHVWTKRNVAKLYNMSCIHYGSTGEEQLEAFLYI